MLAVQHSVIERVGQAALSGGIKKPVGHPVQAALYYDRYAKHRETDVTADIRGMPISSACHGVTKA
jgi:hypothetical protein